MQNLLPSPISSFQDLPALACKRTIMPIPFTQYYTDLPSPLPVLACEILPIELSSIPSKLHGFNISSQEQLIKIKPRTVQKLSKTFRSLRGSKTESLVISNPYLCLNDFIGASKLNIVLPNAKDCDIQSLSSFLTRLQNLKSLKLSINCKNVSKYTAHCLLFSLRNLKDLTSLSLDFQGCSNFNDKSMKTLSMSIKSLQSLSSLKVNFTDAKNLTDKSIDSLANTFRYLRSLTHLDLSFNSWNITDSSMKALITGLNRLQTLENLNLNFQFRKITGFGLQFRGLKNLKVLDLNMFGCTEINEEGVRNIATGIQKLKSLQQIHLNFGLCKQISDQGIKVLSESFEHLSNLSKLHIDLESCAEITASGISELSNNLTNLQYLEILNINLSGCNNIADPCFRAFGSNLRELASLKELTLDFFGCSSFTDQALQSLTQGLVNKSSLKKLDIQVPASNITDQGVERFGEILKTLRSLTVFSIRFGGNFRNLPQITDKALESLAKSLNGLKNLSDLFLCFNFCRNISSQGLEALSEGIKDLSELKVLKYNFFCGLVIGESENEILMRVNAPQMILNYWK